MSGPRSGRFPDIHVAIVASAANWRYNRHVEFLIPITFFIMVFGPIFYVTKRRYDLREKQLAPPEQPKLLQKLNETNRALEELREERKLLQARIENLESVVCSVDYELNARLAALPSQPALPAPAEAAPAESESGGDVATSATVTDIKKKAAGAGRAVAGGELTIGALVAKRYRIERLVGRGGMGAVYQAHDQVLGDSVALKVISSLWGESSQEVYDRFRREASAARRVSATNVIRIHDIGELDDGRPYISMEYFAGSPMADLMRARGTLDSADGHDILAQVCDGLQAAHEAGVIHRDLKPQNILVGPRSAVKLIDFGLAKSVFMPELTATGLIMGSPHYMSPEQVRGRNVDSRSDIYALGAVAYHAMAGRPVFSGDTPIAIGFAHCSETPVPPRTLRPAMSERLSDMILAALSKSPGDRPQSALEFRAALDLRPV